MSVTTALLRLRHPAFSGVPMLVVERCISEAESRTDSEVWGDRYDQGVMWLAAHLIAISPEFTQGGGECACDAEGMTSYLRERKRMARVVAGGPWGAWRR